MTRVISGVARGRRMSVPEGRGTRPTSDRAREGLFSTLESLLGPMAGLRFADLFAGSGAVGLEAASRGAEHVLLVEHDARALHALRANVAGLALSGVEVVASRVERVVADQCAGSPYDVVFLDPPYDLAADRLEVIVAALAEQHWLADDVVVVVERATRGPEWRWPSPIDPERSRTYGEATLWYGRAAIPPDVPSSADAGSTAGE